MKFVDSHCHLDRLELPEGVTLSQTLRDARDRGVCHFLNIGVERESIPQVLAIAEAHADVSCSVGTHPLYEGIHASEFDWIRDVALHPKVVAIGETGLDYYYQPDSAEAQRRSFRAHIGMARELGLPLIVHTRQAQQDTLQLLKAEGASAFGGVLHCFTEDWEMASAALDLGFYISLSGIVTFRNADSLREVARKVPADRLLIETDSPWLAPVPYRGKSNLPAYVVEVAQCIARERGVELASVAAQTTANFCRLFHRAVVSG